MKILFITSYPVEYNTSANIRNLGLLGGLLKNGNEVSTLSPYPNNRSFFSGKLSSLPFKKRYWIGGEGDNEDSAGTSSNKRPGKIKKILEGVYSSIAVYDRRSWLKRLITNNSVDEDFDIVISSSDPKSAHVLAEKLIKVRPTVCKRWIQYWGDPFIGDITINSSLNSVLIKREEKRILGKSSKSVFVSPFTAENIKCRLPQLKDKIEFIPIPYIEKKNRVELQEGTLISYLGNYTVSRRDIRPLVNAINDLQLPAAIVGDSDIKIEENEHLIVRERMNGSELEEITNKTRVFVCVCNTQGTQIPGKVYHYVDTGKPILIILDGDYSEQMKDYFESFKRFYLCNNNEKDIKETLVLINKENKTFDVPDSLKPEKIAEKFVSF